MSAQPPTHPYTCLACSLAFTTAQTQRTHYSTDLHRYNSKRAVAGLSPIDLDTFNQKFNPNNHSQSTNSTAATPHLPFRCQPCRKSFSTQNAYRNHLISKKHIQEATTTKSEPFQQKSNDTSQSNDSSRKSTTPSKLNEMDVDPTSNSKTPSASKPTTTDSLLDQLIQLRIDQAPEINPNECLFCPRSKKPLQFDDVDHALKHMLTEHGFFLPDQEFLVDKVGLLKYLVQTISVWNVCIYCGAGFGGKMEDNQDDAHLASATRNGLNSVRKHMCDKNHCKLAWDTEEDRLEYSDFFDYRSSYKKTHKINSTKKNKSTIMRALVEEENSEWEDESMKSDDDEATDEEGVASYGDSMFELVLPNGVRLGHRSLRHIYKQNLLPYSVGSQSTPAGNRNMNLITRLAILSSQSSSFVPTLGKWAATRPTASLTRAALIPTRGGGINFNLNDTLLGHQDQVLQVKDRGQARFAGRHIRTFKDTHKQLQFQNRVSCKSGNNQKHYRDPLLQ